MDKVVFTEIDKSIQPDKEPSDVLGLKIEKKEERQRKKKEGKK